MKKILVLFCLCGLSWGVYQVFPIFKSLYTLENGSPDQPAPAVAQSVPDPQVSLRTIDVDAMAARMRKYQDIYRKLRDDSLAVYAKLHPTATKHDKEAETAIRLACYLWVWDDFYKEGLWKTFGDYMTVIADHPQDSPIFDPMLNVAWDFQYYREGYCNKDSAIDQVEKRVESLQGSGYPDAFKFWGYMCLIRSLEDAQRDSAEMKQTMAKSFALLPQFTDKEIEQYGMLVKQKLPDYMLYMKGKQCIDLVEHDASMLTYTAAGIDKVFGQEASGSVVGPSLQGAFYASYAWNARGGGYADTVTNEGWRLMNERLAKASEILENAAINHPNEKMIAEIMLRVELGQGKGRERMEKWFHVAVDSDPDDLKAYEMKLYYLLPRWYGSDEEVWNFCVECLKTQNWGGNVPMVIVSGLEYMHPDASNSQFYADPKIWGLLEPLFQTYLQHYPQSMIYRSRFAKYAAQGGHWGTAKQQFTILGNEWDRDVFSEEEYAAMKRDSEQHAKDNQ